MLLKTKGEDLDKAENYHEQALSIFERVYGSRHDKVALTLNLLAEVHRKMGKLTYDGAERLYERALEINRACFGETHPEIAENLNGYVLCRNNKTPRMVPTQFIFQVSASLQGTAEPSESRTRVVASN